MQRGAYGQEPRAHPPSHPSQLLVQAAVRGLSLYVAAVDGMQGGTTATRDLFIEYVGVPTLAGVPQALWVLQELGRAP